MVHIALLIKEVVVPPLQCTEPLVVLDSHCIIPPKIPRGADTAIACGLEKEGGRHGWRTACRIRRHHMAITTSHRGEEKEDGAI